MYDNTKAGENVTLQFQWSQEERSEMVVRNLYLVKMTALRLMGRLPDHITYDELFSSGVVGLIDAVDKYDPSYEIPFEQYALIRIRGSMIDDIRSKDVVPRGVRSKLKNIELVVEKLEQRLGRYPEDEEVANELGIDISEYYQFLDGLKGISLSCSFEDLLESGQHPECLASDAEDPVQSVYINEIKNMLVQAIKRLPEREQLVLSLYYYEELTMKEIGEILGYTESRISQLHTSIILKLRTRLKRILKKDDLPEGVSD